MVQPKRAAVISLGSESSKRTIKALKEYFPHVDDIDIRHIEVVLGGPTAELLYEGKPLPQYDCAYIKGSYKYASVAKSMASIMEDTTYMPNAASAFTIAHNKLLTHIELQKYNIPMPKTYVSATVKAGKALLRTVKYPIIIKLPEGTHGIGVMFADSYAAASSVLDTLQNLKQPFLIQEFIETGGKDIRAIVVGERVVASMQRIASTGEVRSNFHQQGTAESYKLTPQIEKICVRIAQALHSDICGVDLLQGPKGALCIEANVSPGLQGIMATTNVDIPSHMAKYMYERTQAFMEQKIQGQPSSQRILHSMGINTVEEHASDDKQIITHLQIRASRIVLPELITNIAQIDEATEYAISVKPHNITIKKY